MNNKKKQARRLIEEMIKAGINQNEIVQEIGCSRWMLHLWRAERHDPSDESMSAIMRAHEKFRPASIPKLSSIVRELEDRGFNLSKTLKCTKVSISNWKSGVRPQAKFRTKIIKLYEAIRKAA